MKISKLAAFAIAAIMSVHAAVPSAAATGQGIRPTPFGEKSTLTTASVKQGGSAKKKGFSVSLSDTEYVYNGKKRKPRVVVRHGSSILSRSDYKVSYGHGRRRVGTYSVTVKLRRNYSGKLVTAFTILPKATCINSIIPAGYHVHRSAARMGVGECGPSLRRALPPDSSFPFR